ncbi:MAG: 50S ribosomal protein L23 [Acidobacteria bacterium]|nr:50S ribosomal protein L23 [Acidobacteriota bacterium]
MTKNPYQILRKPVITEKSMDAKELARTLCFKVDPRATKQEIKEAVQVAFKVKVESVRTATYLGKERRRGRTSGRRPDWKKAFVKVKAGEKMPEYVESA